MSTPIAESRADRTRAWLRRYWPLLVGALLLLLVRLPVEAHRTQWPRQQILDAIRAVESSGRESPPDGDGGRAIGPYQIHRAYWQDAIAAEPEIAGDYQDCRQRAYAEGIIAAYMRVYCPQAWSRGRAETIARIHNGGPRGQKIKATLPYWKRVRQKLPD